MENITKEFTYPVTDDQYSGTMDENNTGTLTYEGPAMLRVLIERSTNKLTRGHITEDEWDNGEFNNVNDEKFAVEVDCETNPLVCTLVYGLNVNDVNQIVEEIPNNPLPYKRHDPMLPDHVYDVPNIEYSHATSSFISPFPLHPPIDSWESKVSERNNYLYTADTNDSDDLPDNLATAMANYKRYLREFLELFGASWTITLAAAGTGYSQGDQLLISDPAYKNNTNAPDILLTVTTVNSDGAITAFTTSNKHNWTYQEDAASHTNVYYSTSSAGTGAQINMSTLKLVPPHKINILRNPLNGLGKGSIDTYINLFS